MWDQSFTCVARRGWLRRLSMCNVAGAWVRCDLETLLCATWLVYVCDMSRLYVWHDVYMCGTAWLTETTFYLRRDSFMCVTWHGRLHMCDVTRVCVRHDMCDMTLWYVWHGLVDWDAVLCATCDVTRLCVQRDWDAFTSATWLGYVCDMTCLYVWHASFTCVARRGWLRRLSMRDVPDACLCRRLSDRRQTNRIWTNVWQAASDRRQTILCATSHIELHVAHRIVWRLSDMSDACQTFVQIRFVQIRIWINQAVPHARRT